MQRYEQCVLCTCVVPWDEYERLDERSFRSEVRRMRQWFDHLYIFGTAGEGHAVDLGRFRDVCSVFAEEMRGAHAQAGVIAGSTALTIDRIGIASEIGYRTFQISLPSWGALRDGEVLRFFQDVCSAFPDCAFVHYNVARAGRLLSAADYRRIADTVPNLVATKITGSDEDFARALIREVPELQHFFVRMFPFGIRLGECSLLSAHAPHSPRAVCQMFEAGLRGEWDAMDAIAARFSEFDGAVFEPVRGRGYVDGAYDKLRVQLGGVRFPLRMLSPWDSFDPSDAALCLAIARERFSDVLERG